MRRVSAVATLMLVVALFLPATTASAAGPTGPPPGNAHVLSPGQIPTTCTEDEINNAGASAYGSTYGAYWSDVSNRWVQAPWCYPRWGYLAMSTSVIVSAGDTVTATALPDDPSLSGWITGSHLGTMDWSHPGDLVSGCGLYDLTCTVRMGERNRPPAEWSWGEFHVSAPGRVFILPASYAPRCQPEAPCLDTVTNAWSFVGVRPAYVSPPDADFTYTIDGGTVDFTATSTDPAHSVLFHEWDFDDGTGNGANPSHTYTKSGTYSVTLTSTNEAHLSDSITKDIEVTAEPLSITKVAIDPADAEVGHPAKATIEITNSGDAVVTAITPTVTVTPPEIVTLAEGEEPPTFDLAAGEKRSFDVMFDPLQTGEAFLNVLASGTLDGATTSAKARQLAFDVVDGALRIEPVVPEAKLPGEEVTVGAKITNNGTVAIVGITPTLEIDPATGTTLGEPTVDSIPRLEPGQHVTVEWPLKVEDSEKRTLDFTAIGKDDAAPPDDLERKATAEAEYTAGDGRLIVTTRGDEALPDDARDLGICDVDVDEDGNQCTLRAAIELANDQGGAWDITFDIPGAAVPQISPASPLPDITASVTLDGRTQEAKFVELSGPDSGAGLHVLGSNSVIAGLVINGFDVGLDVGGDGGHRVIGNRIGTDVLGALSKPNFDGIHVTGPNVTIGGTTDTSTGNCTGDCNLISGNGGYGVNAAMDNGGPYDASGAGFGYPGTHIEGNWIGIDVTGNLAVKNHVGIRAAADTVVGGSTDRAGAAPGNLISGNGLGGVEMNGQSSAFGNLVGSTDTGTEPLGNGRFGFATLQSPSIGGTGPGEGNVIVGQRVPGAAPILVPTARDAVGAGIVAEGGHYAGNQIGIGLDGVVIPNDVGVYTGDRGGHGTTDNTISGNDIGVLSETFAKVPCGSRIGTDPTGMSAVPNRIGILGRSVVGPVGGDTCPPTVISGNTVAGVAGESFQLNGPLSIGTNADGTAAIPNAVGVLSTPQAASTEGARIAELAGALQSSGCVKCLVVAGNTGDGVAIASAVGSGTLVNVRIADALIGVTGDGTILPNGGAGIHITASLGDDGAGHDSFIVRSSIVGNVGPGLVLDDPGASEAPLHTEDNGFSRNATAIKSRTVPSRVDSAERNADGTIRVRGVAFGTSASIEFFGNRPALCQAEVPLAHAALSLAGAFDISVPAPPAGFDAISIITTNGGGRPSQASTCRQITGTAPGSSAGSTSGTNPGSTVATPAGTTSGTSGATTGTTRGTNVVSTPGSTTVTQRAVAGSLEVQVASNAGFGPGDYAQLGPNGPILRINRLGSLIFDTPIPFDLEVGTVITRVAAPPDAVASPVIATTAPTPDGAGDVGDNTTDTELPVTGAPIERELSMALALLAIGCTASAAAVRGRRRDRLSPAQLDR